MNTLVRLQVTLLSEALSTSGVVTHKGLLSSLRQLRNFVSHTNHIEFHTFNAQHLRESFCESLGDQFVNSACRRCRRGRACRPCGSARASSGAPS